MKILYQIGLFTVRAAVFGRRKSEGFQVFRDGAVAATCVYSIGYPGAKGLARAIKEADRLHEIGARERDT